MDEKERRLLRKSRIKARNALTAEERKQLSERIAKRIITSKIYKNAKTIMLYRATHGEVTLRELERAAEQDGKLLAYPRCISDTDMVALHPHEEDAWEEGHFGIWEPVMQKSDKVAPWDIDLVICPCTVFDERGGRMGMGKGYYDRYLEKCKYTKSVSVAFEVQKADYVPMEPWDKFMKMVFTEKTIYIDGKGRRLDW